MYSSMLARLKQNPCWVLVPLFLFIYIFSLTFHYVEGDDAYSVFYHVLGNINIQGPYASYQGMMDVIMHLLPKDETTIRIFAISFHAFFGMLFPMLIIRLIRTYGISNGKEDHLLLFAFLMPFIMPEFIFFGLYYQCSSVAMCLLLIAHLIWKQVYSNTSVSSKLPKILLGAVIFGIGVCFRWDTGLYLLVVLFDLWMTKTDNLKKKNLILPSVGNLFLLSLCVGACVIGLIYAEGYSFHDIIFRMSSSQDLVAIDNRKISWKENIGSGISVFTPFTIIFLIIGSFFSVAKKKPYLLLLFIIAYTPILKLLPTEILNPRRIINSLPAMVTLCYVGYYYILEAFVSQRKLVFTVILIVVFIPWAVGMQINTNATMWGPGFDIKRTIPTNNISKTEIGEVDSRIEVKSFKPVLFQGGFAVPFEGPRPLWGYADVIFGGKWRKLITYQNDERDDMIAKARTNKYPILQLDFGVNMMINLLRDGYTTKTKKGGIEIGENIFMRKFYKPGADTITFVYPKTYSHLGILDSNYIKTCCKLLNTDTLGLYIYSSSLLMEMKNLYPAHVINYGPTTGIITFHRN